MITKEKLKKTNKFGFTYYDIQQEIQEYKKGKPAKPIPPILKKEHNEKGILLYAEQYKQYEKDKFNSMKRNCFLKLNLDLKEYQTMLENNEILFAKWGKREFIRLEKEQSNIFNFNNLEDNPEIFKAVYIENNKLVYPENLTNFEYYYQIQFENEFTVDNIDNFIVNEDFEIIVN